MQQMCKEYKDNHQDQYNTLRAHCEGQKIDGTSNPDGSFIALVLQAQELFVTNEVMGKLSTSHSQLIRSTRGDYFNCIQQHDGFQLSEESIRAWRSG
jgi:hypothetical protein